MLTMRRLLMPASRSIIARVGVMAMHQTAARIDCSAIEI